MFWLNLTDLRLRRLSINVLLVFLIFTACDDVLQTEDQTAVDANRVFNEPELAILFLNSIYDQNLPSWSALSNVGLTEESSRWSGFLAGTIEDPTSNNRDETPGNYSSSEFAKIRNINAFIAGVREGNIDSELKTSLLAQAYFFRAWTHWSMVFDYGGIPMVTEVLDNNDNISDELPRLSASECVEIIINDLDFAIDNLGKAQEHGRVTRSAAAAVKGRVLLFFASPIFVSGSGIEERWQKAFEANQGAKEIADSEGHGLYGEEGGEDFNEIFLNEDNKEWIFFRKYTFDFEKTHGYEGQVRPGRVGRSSEITSFPSWDLIESFPMKDGTSIVSNPEYNQETFWYNRDPRFYATIGFNSGEWKFDDDDDLRQWTYVGNEQQDGFVPSTGAYIKKHVDTSLPQTLRNRTSTDWVELRYAEILLNLAECANEIGRSEVAYENLYAIRKRAGIEEGTGSYGLASGLNKEELREIIMNERLIEFAYENKRYWDLKRRKLFENKLNGTRRRGVITTIDTTYLMSILPGWGEDSILQYFEQNLLDTLDWSNPVVYDAYFTTKLEELDPNGISYLEKYNFFYLPLNALINNDNLEQTKGWLDENGEIGIFDPLED